MSSDNENRDYNQEQADSYASAQQPADSYSQQPVDAYGRPVYSGQTVDAYGRPLFYDAQSGTYYTQSQGGYSQQYTAYSGMYTPGIDINQQHPQYNTGSSIQVSNNKSSGGGFVRAVFIVLACTFFSAIAAYAVTDYRFRNGDFTVETTQVVLGGNSPSISAPDDNASPQIALLPDNTISPQDVYDIALTQVVGVCMTTPAFSGWITEEADVPSVVGSGFIISEDGYILTNYHVVEMAHERKMPISVVMHSGDFYEATVVGFEKSNDVAVLKIEKDGLNPAVIGNSSSLRVGQSVYAVGNPFGDLVYTMTDGIISALDRVVSVEGKTINAFQFSAAVNSGNSGGPVYNTNGEVIGIVTAKVVRGSVEGIGFAIPINDAVDIAVDLIEQGYVSGRPLLGVTVRTVLPAHADYFGWVTGSFVLSVAENSAAHKAGISLGDIIVALDDCEIDSNIALNDAMRNYRAGDTAKITVWRDGKTVVLTITFDENLNAGRPDAQTPVIDYEVDPFESFPGWME